MAKAKSSAPAAQQVKVTLIKSMAGQLKSHQATVRGLGLRRIRDSALLVATPEVNGMLRSAHHMLKVENA
jgi:large subunit ribosomal protein L30